MGNRKRLRPQPAVTTPVAVQGDDLGDLGQDNGTINLHFGWFGRRVRVNPGAGELELNDFLIASSGIDVGETDMDVNKSVEAMTAVYAFLKAQIHPDDWAEFYDLAKTHRQTTMDLMRVAMRIVDNVTDFPTTPPAGSGAGTEPTRQKSKGGSSSREQKALELTRAALSQVPATRPDIAVAYVEAFEERTRAGR
jgi:hypothetical protein